MLGDLICLVIVILFAIKLTKVYLKPDWIPVHLVVIYSCHVVEGTSVITGRKLNKFPICNNIVLNCIACNACKYCNALNCMALYRPYHDFGSHLDE